MRSSSGYYWISDIVNIQGEIKELESQPGSSEPLIEFRTNRKKLVEDTYKVSLNSVHTHLSNLLISRTWGDVRNGLALMLKRKRLTLNVSEMRDFLCGSAGNS